LLAIALIFVSTYLSLYAFKAYTAAALHIYEELETGKVFWTSGPAGSLFPWPTEPGMLEILVQVDGVDLFIYVYLIRSWLLTGFPVLSWFVTGLYVFVARRKGLLLRS
jgi:hypothetical protein